MNGYTNSKQIREKGIEEHNVMRKGMKKKSERSEDGVLKKKTP